MLNNEKPGTGPARRECIGLRDYFRDAIGTHPEHYLYECLVVAVTRMITDGRLLPGARLPSLRSLSRRLDVSLSTGMRAYNSLVKKGIVEKRSRSGYFVSPPRSGGLPLPLAGELSMQPAAPGHVRSYCMAAAQREPECLVPAGELPLAAVSHAVRRVRGVEARESLPAREPFGFRPLRDLIAHHVDPRQQAADCESVAVTTGWMGGLEIALRAFVPAGAHVAVQSPAPPEMYDVVAAAGCSVLEVPSNPESGIRVDAVETLAAQGGIHALVCMPNYAHPTGAVLEHASRRDLLDVAGGHGLRVIEVGTLGEFGRSDQELASLLSLDRRGLVVNCGGFCNSIAPEYCVGWVAGSRTSIAPMRECFSGSGPRIPQPSMMAQRILAEFLRIHDYARHVERLRRSLRFQYTCARKLIEQHFPAGTAAVGANGAPGLWVQLPASMNAEHVVKEVCGPGETIRGVRMRAGNCYSLEGAYTDKVSLSLREPWSPAVEATLAEVGDRLCRRAGTRPVSAVV